MIKQFKLFDSHLHIIDPQYPLVANNGYIPEAFTAQDYLARMKAYHLAGGAIVSGSFQAFDQAYLIQALTVLGPAFVGVTQLPINTPNDEIIKLNTLGVRAVRFNLKRGGSEDIKNLASMAARIYELAHWHVELYVDAKELPELFEVLVKLPQVSIDHLGLSQAGMACLLKLVERGVKVKACGFGRVDFDVSTALKALFTANPHALMFGTDLPSTRAPRPYNDDDFLLVADTLGLDAAQKVFSLNAINLYKPRMVNQ